MASISCVQTYGSNKNAGFFGYANGNYTYGYYNVTFNYSGISHDGGTLNINGAYVNLKNPNSGYTTNTVYINSVIVNGTNVGLSASEKGNKSYHSFSTPSKNVSVSCGASATSCTVAVNCSRTGGGSQTLYGTLSFSSSTGSFNLNILLPDGSEPYTTGAAGSVEFSSNGGSSYTRLYNEPSNSYVIGTSFVCRNFTPGTGLHLSGTSGFNSNGGSGPWYATQGSSTVLTFKTAWNTYTVTYNGNGATGGSTANSSHTYNTAKALTANGYTRTGYKFAGWSMSKTATSATYSDKQSVSNLTTTNGGTVTLYAVWTLIAPSSVVHTTTRRRDKIGIDISYSGVAISNITAYYRANSTGNYSSLSLGTSKTGVISGLQPNTSYQIYVTVTNSAGSANSTAAVVKTGAYLPTNLNVAINNMTPMSVVANVSATAETNASNTNYKVYYTKKINKDTSDMAIMSLSDGSLWGRIFYHNCKEGSELFTSLAQIKDVNTDTKYSKLNSISKYKLSSGKYEFLLRYPNQSTGYNRWRQTNAPQDEFVTITSDGSGKAAGYEAIHIDWTDNYWGGLTRQSSDTSAYSPCYLSGSVGHGNWYYAIGAAAAYEEGIPSYTSTWGSVELWVRLDDTNVTTVDLGTNTSKNITGLTPETSYSMWMSVSNVGGTNYSKLVNFTTPADQAKIRIKRNGSWAKGKTYFKKDGQWVKAKKVYIKVNGEWKINNNYDS